MAYFKFTWSLRQFNMLSLVVPRRRRDEGSGRTRNALRINACRGRKFNRGIRAYYFGLAAVFWFIQPWMFIARHHADRLVLYRRDFRSRPGAMRCKE